MSRPSSSGPLSRRYAKALFALATEQNAVEAVRQNAEDLTKALKSEALSELISNPLMSQDVLTKTVGILSEQLKLHSLTQQFLARLVANRRLDSLPQILGQFFALVRKDRGESLVTVQTAAALSEEARKKLVHTLELKLGTVSLREEVDKSLLAGIVIRKESQLLDASLAGRLQQLHKALR